MFAVFKYIETESNNTLFSIHTMTSILRERASVFEEYACTLFQHTHTPLFPVIWAKVF